MHASRSIQPEISLARGRQGAEKQRTNLLCEVVPLEPAQVLDAPQVVVVGAAPLPAHGVAVQHLRGRLGHTLVLELRPALAEVLAAVAAHLLAPLARRGVCAMADNATITQVDACKGIVGHLRLQSIMANHGGQQQGHVQ